MNVIPRSEATWETQTISNDIMNVILNVVKNLLSGNTLSTLSIVGFEEIATSGKALLAMTEYSITLAMTHTHNNVILNVVKNLKVSETVDGSANLEILRAAQDDKTQRGDPSRCSG